MAQPKNTQKIKIALLGHGNFAKPSFDIIKKKYKIVDQLEADCIIVANYGKILSPQEINRPKFGVINLHGSLLPKYRGPCPVQSTIANGDQQTGITIIKIDEKVDHGPILVQKKIKITNTDTTESLLVKLGCLCAENILLTLKKYFTGHLKLEEQDHSLATFTSKQDKIIMDPSDNPKLLNIVRAYAKEPGVFIKLKNNQLIKIISAKKSNNKFIPDLVQIPGKKILKYSDFINGYKYHPPWPIS